MEVEALIARAAVQARPYQQRVVARAADLFTTHGLRSVLIDSPTGSGKTIMGLLTARALQERLGVRVGWVAMRRYLLAQAREENESRRIGVEATFLSMFDRDPPTGLDLLVADEAQHDAAQSMAHLHQRIRPRFILGLSATPFRADRVKLCFDSAIEDAGIQGLIEDGYLSPYHHYTLPRHTPEAVVQFYLKDRPRWGKSLFYFHTLGRCAEADGLLRAAGVRSEVVTGNSDRERQLEAFRGGRCDVLVNCMMLSEGFNCPELKTVFCRPSCRSVTIQMVDVLALRRVLAEQERPQEALDRRLDDAGALGEGGAAQAVQPRLAGQHLDHDQAALRRRRQDGLDVGDLQRRQLPVGGGRLGAGGLGRPQLGRRGAAGAAVPGEEPGQAGGPAQGGPLEHVASVHDGSLTVPVGRWTAARPPGRGEWCA
jgi:hypothetical protein